MSTSAPSVARSSAVMASGSVASRLLGVLRQSLLVLAIGQGIVGNAFVLANTIPNIIYMILAGGVLNSVLVPQLVKAAKNPDGGREYTDRIISLSVSGFLVVTLVCTAGAGLLVRLYSQDLAPDTLWLATFFAALTLPQILFYGIFALLGQVLNARGQFAAFGWAPALANVVQIAGLVAFMTFYNGHVEPSRWTSPMVLLLAGSATLGVVLQAIFLIVPLWRSGFRWSPRFGVRGVGLRSTSSVAGWAFAALIVSQLGFVVASNVMSHASGQAGRVGRFVPGLAVYSNALFVFMVPHAFVAVSIITALYPRMARAAQERNLVRQREEYVRGLTLPTALTMPASFALLFFAVPITGVLFTSVNPEELPATSLVLIAMSLGVIPFGIDVLNQRFFYARDEGRLALGEQLVLTGSATVVVLLTLAFPPWYTVAIIGVGIVVSNILSASFGLWFVARRVGPLPVARIVRGQVRMLIASLVAGALALPVFTVVRVFLPLGRWGDLGALAVGGGVFGVVYLLMALALRSPEVQTMVGRIPVLRRLRVRRNR